MHMGRVTQCLFCDCSQFGFPFQSVQRVMGIIQELFGSQVLWIALWIILPAFLITVITDCNGRPAGQRQDLPN